MARLADGGSVMDAKNEILRCINSIANAMDEIDHSRCVLRDLVGTEYGLVQMLGNLSRTVYVTSGIDTIADACGCAAEIKDRGSCREIKTFTYLGIDFNQITKMERKEYD